MEGNPGQLTAEVLKQHGIEVVYTLSGAHIFPIYDGCVARDIKLVDFRHEQSAAFAAEGHAKLTRSPGVVAVTAGPGVTNTMSTVVSASFNGSPLVVLGGRAPTARWGAGSLQEMDHLPLMSSVTKFAATMNVPEETPALVTKALEIAATPHRGPVFLDFPLDLQFGTTEAEIPARKIPRGQDPDSEAIASAADLLSGATKPVILAGSDVWLDRAEMQLASFASNLAVPVFLNGLGRGLLPRGHTSLLSKVRSTAMRGADLVIVIGTPLDFRASFGEFGDAKLVHIIDSPGDSKGTRAPDVVIAGDISSALMGIENKLSRKPDTAQWLTQLVDEEALKRAAQAVELEADGEHIQPSRVYGELLKVLDEDAVVVCDGGDFVSFAGRYVERHVAGTWLDAGPFGCLGTGAGYAIAAKTLYPGRQVVLLWGDGAAGFSIADIDTMVRHKLPVVAVIGNNNCWMLEKNPMQMMYGYTVAAELGDTTRYDQVAQALGGGGELVTDALELPGALKRAFDSGIPYVVNVMIDPDVAYPRTSNLL